MNKGQKVVIKNTNSVWDGKEGIVEEINEDSATVFVNFIPEQHKRVRQIFNIDNLDIDNYDIDSEVNNMNEDLNTNGELMEDANEDWTDRVLTALSEYFEVDVDDIEVSGWNDHNFIVNGDEYWVGTYDEAYDAAVEYSRSILDDLGLDALSPDYKDYVIMNFVNTDEVEDWMRESFEYYIEDIEEEQDSEYGSRLIAEMVDNDIISEDDFVDDELPEDVYKNAKERYLDKLCDQDAVDWLFDNFGNEDASKMLIDNNAIDYDAIAEDCVDTDGIAHYLASYDGVEIDLGDDLYAYRVD